MIMKFNKDDLSILYSLIGKKLTNLSYIRANQLLKDDVFILAFDNEYFLQVSTFMRVKIGKQNYHDIMGYLHCSDLQQTYLR